MKKTAERTSGTSVLRKNEKENCEIEQRNATMEFAEAICKPRVDNVAMIRGPKRQLLRRNGCFAITGHHLIYTVLPESQGDNVKDKENQNHENEIWVVLHKLIDRVDLKPTSPDDMPGAKMELYLKDLMKCIFEISNFQDALAVRNSINILSNLTDLSLHAPFSHRNIEPITDENGWNLYSIEKYHTFVNSVSDGKFRCSDANKGFSLCESYPEKLIVPSNSTDDWLQKSATFRANGRLPILAYYHQKTKSSILISSQPLVGANGKRCKEDESLLNSLIGDAHKGFIVDTRSHSVANAAKNKGGGLEQEMYYSRWKRIHSAVPKWVTLKEAYSKLVEACNDYGTEKFYGRIASSNWLQCVHDALNCATCIALRVETPADPFDNTVSGPEYQPNEVPVLVHGADGFDSTLLVTSLAVLILDPDSRTINGFETLIERVWLSFGHPFSLRWAHGPYASGEITGPYEAPTFLLFLDCVWQGASLYQRLYNERSGLSLVRRLCAQLSPGKNGCVNRNRSKFGAILAAVAFSFVENGVPDEDIDDACSLSQEVWNTLPALAHPGNFNSKDDKGQPPQFDLHGQYYRFDPGRLPEESVHVENGDGTQEAQNSSGNSLGGEWHLVLDGDDFRMWRRPFAQSDGRLNEYRCIGRYSDVSPAAFFRVQIDNEYRKTWDKLVIALDTIDVDEESGAEVIRWVTKFPYPLSPREYIFVRRACVDRCQNRMVIAGRALDDHPQLAQRQNEAAYYLRVTVYNSTMVIKPHAGFEQMGLDFVLTYVDDPQAPLPSATQRWMLKYGLPGYLENVRQAAKQLSDCDTADIQID